MRRGSKSLVATHGDQIGNEKSTWLQQPVSRPVKLRPRSHACMISIYTSHIQTELVEWKLITRGTAC